MTARQSTFGFADDLPVETRLPPVTRAKDPATSHTAEHELNRSGRRTTQLDRILGRLRQGPATNRELAKISLKYTGRVSDARSLGHVIEVEQRGRGITLYSLTHDAGDVRRGQR